MAGFNLQDFISNNNDFARGYTFYILIDNPYGAQGMERLKYLVRSSTLPNSTIDPTEVNWQGNAYKLGTTHNYADWSCTFSVDPKDTIRHDFLEWMKGIHDVETNYHGDPSDYLNDITLQHVDQYSGDTIMTYKLIDTWPTVVGDMTIDYASKETATFDVTWQFQYFTTS